MSDAGGIRAGSAFVSIGANTQGLDKAIAGIGGAFDKLDKKIGSFGGGFSKIGSKFGNVGGSIAKVGASIAGIGAAGVAGMVALTKQFSDVAGAVDDVAQRTGAGGAAISELGYAASQSGSSLGAVESSMKKLQVNIAGGSEEFAKLGIDMAELKSLSPEEQFERVGKAVAAIEDPAERTQTAMKLFGKSGTELLPMFAQLSELRQEARDTGVALSDMEIADGAALGDSFDKVGKIISGIGVRIGAALAGPLSKILDVIANIGTKAIEWAKNNQGVIQTAAAIAATVAGIGGVIATVGAGIVGIGAVLTGIGGIVSAIGAGFGVLGSVVGAVLSPIGLVAAAVVGLGGYIAYVALEATGGFGKLSEMFGSLGETVSEVWGGIGAAISSGDIETAGKIAFLGLEIAWLTVTSSIQDIWQGVTGFLSATWNEVTRTIVMGGLGMWNGLQAAADQGAAFLLRAFDEVAKFTLDLFDGIGTAIEKAAVDLKAFLGLIDRDTASKTQKRLDSELEKRKQGRADAVSANAQARQQNIDDRSKARQKTQDEWSKAFDKRTNDALTKKEDPTLKQKQDELTKMRAELAALSGGAKDKAAADAAAKAAAAAAPKEKSLAETYKSRAISAQPPAPERVALGQMAAESAVRFASAESIGSFSGRAASQQGYVSSVQEQQRDLLATIATNTGKTADAQQQQLDMERE